MFHRDRTVVLGTKQPLLERRHPNEARETERTGPKQEAAGMTEPEFKRALMWVETLRGARCRRSIQNPNMSLRCSSDIPNRDSGSVCTRA